MYQSLWRLVMNQQQQHSIVHSSNSESAQVPTAKQGMEWQQPDFEEFDLCMEVTAYINHWQ